MPNQDSEIQMSGISSTPTRSYTRPSACSVAGSECSIPNERRKGIWGQGTVKDAIWNQPNESKTDALELKWHCDLHKMAEMAKWVGVNIRDSKAMRSKGVVGK
ncbi:hypothetical protein SESBI_33061 [Sesbania bispinosa]|nr:hypothetical protein SESBI_33061 [Sesbania bispinosa]